MTPPAAARALSPRGAALPAPPLTAPRRPRRVSGPARGVPAAAPRARERGGPLAAAARLGALAERRLLARLIAGKAWIALVAFALIGIVTLQLALLELNGHIGRALARETVLQRENAALSIADSELTAGGRVESRAAMLGMELVPAGTVRFLHAGGAAGVQQAVRALRSTASTPSSNAATSTSASGGEATTGQSEAPTGSTQAPPAETQSAPTSTAPPAVTAPSGAEPSGASSAPAAASVPAGEGGGGEASAPVQTSPAGGTPPATGG